MADASRAGHEPTKQRHLVNGTVLAEQHGFPFEEAKQGTIKKRTAPNGLPLSFTFNQPEQLGTELGALASPFVGLMVACSNQHGAWLSHVVS